MGLVACGLALLARLGCSTVAAGVSALLGTVDRGLVMLP
jgi:hypothetical protein